eukprot:gene20340-20937_t
MSRPYLAIEHVGMAFPTPKGTYTALEINAPGPDRAVVFQNHSLLPWLTVYGNVKLAVDKVLGKSKSRAERHAWIMHNLELVGMAQAADKHPVKLDRPRRRLELAADPEYIRCRSEVMRFLYERQRHPKAA